MDEDVDLPLPKGPFNIIQVEVGGREGKGKQKITFDFLAGRGSGLKCVMIMMREVVNTFHFKTLTQASKGLFGENILLFTLFKS